ncbi:putative transcriptional regulator [Erwinia toletana]|uniref:Transcriptional regulator n=1 Tax=Winslowiella toletana TaxID=92490 RepID=A0ABS4P878_9GAMM|nr:hypothetical protein [Winslowiella toletana]MBP2168133.1 putative transcriptional regulator [Winslowiella toletana]
MVDKRILKMQTLIQRQHNAGTASDKALHEINAIVADAKHEDAKASIIAISDKRGRAIGDFQQRG